MAGVQSVPASAPDSTELLSYVVQECQDFFGHLGSILTQAKEKGTLPPHTFKKGKTDAKKDKVKRKPTAFNNFVRQKIVELRAAGEEGNTNNVFANAVAAWKELSEDQRKSYTDKFSKDGGEEVSLSDLDLPQFPSAVAADNQKKKRKQKADKEAGAAADVKVEAGDGSNKKKKKSKKDKTKTEA